MTKVSKIVSSLGLCFACTGIANASIVLNNWQFDPNGGGGSRQTINEYLDINGNAFIDLTIGGGGSFTFAETGVFNSGQADSNGQFFPLNFPGGNISATFEAVGAGTLGVGFAFTSGTIKIYQNPTNNQYGTTTGTYGADLGNLIGTFSVEAGGGGAVDASGSPLANGQITVFAKMVSIASGYFFDPLGVDLVGSDKVLAFAFTNANTVGSPSQTMIDEIICDQAGFTGPGCGAGTYSNTPGDYIFVSNNGQFKLATVPEPASIALMGLGLIGIGAMRRRTK